MSTSEMTSMIHELRELRRMADELNQQIEAIQGRIRAELTARETDEMSGPDWRVTWRSVTSNRFDTTAFRRAMPDLAASFTRPVTTRRLLVA